MSNERYNHIIPLKDGHELCCNLHEDPMGMPLVADVVGVHAKTGVIKPLAHLATDLRQVFFLKAIAEGAMGKAHEAEEQIAGFSPAVLRYGAAKEYDKVKHAMNAMGEKLGSESQLLQHTVEHAAYNAIEGRETKRFAEPVQHAVYNEPHHGGVPNHKGGGFREV